MSLLYLLLAGFLFGAGVYALLRRSTIRMIFGVLLLSHAVNLFIFVVGTPRRIQPPILGEGKPVADPLPQALLLTALVIGFGFIAYGLTLVSEVYRAHGDEDTEAMSPE